MSLDDIRVAIISGGTSGIGLESARKLLSTGMRVAVLARNHVDAAELGISHDEFVVIECDVTDWESVSSALKKISGLWGRVDVLVNSVGSAPAGYVQDISPDQWLDAFRSKVLGSVGLIQHVLPIMQEQNYGRIINISGTAGKEPDPWMVAAGVMNSALNTITSAFSKDRRNSMITMNAICPGPTKTRRWAGLVGQYSNMFNVEPDEAEQELLRRIPRGVPAQPEDVAHLVAFLASEHAGHITGAVIPIDGGQSAGY